MSSKNRAPRETRRERRAAELAGANAPLPLPEGLNVVAETTSEQLGVPKMSDTLKEFVAPLLDLFDSSPDFDVLQRIFGIGALVWNVSAPGGPPAVVAEIVASILPDGDAQSLEDARTTIEMLVARRTEDFADDPRLIGAGSYAASATAYAWSRRPSCRRSISMRRRSGDGRFPARARGGRRAAI